MKFATSHALRAFHSFRRNEFRPQKPNASSLGFFLSRIMVLAHRELRGLVAGSSDSPPDCHSLLPLFEPAETKKDAQMDIQSAFV